MIPDMPIVSDWIGAVGFLITIIGFLVTATAAIRARRAAAAARDAAIEAASSVKRINLVGELATVIQLLEELKRLHRARAADLLPDRYSILRARMIAIRESGLLLGDREATLVQDAIARIAALEKAYDSNREFLQSTKLLMKSNESLSTCTDSMVSLHESLKNRTAVTL